VGDWKTPGGRFHRTPTVELASGQAVSRVEVVLVLDKSKTGYNIVLVTTDLETGPEHIIER